MPRITLDIDKSVLEEVRKLQQREGRPFGQVITALLAEALSTRRRDQPPSDLEWISKPMVARIDLLDKEALYSGLDETQRS